MSLDELGFSPHKPSTDQTVWGTKLGTWKSLLHTWRRFKKNAVPSDSLSITRYEDVRPCWPLRCLIFHGSCSFLNALILLKSWRFPLQFCGGIWFMPSNTLPFFSVTDERGRWMKAAVEKRLLAAFLKHLQHAGSRRLIQMFVDNFRQSWEKSEALKQQLEVGGASRGFARWIKQSLKPLSFFPIKKKTGKRGNKTHDVESKFSTPGTHGGTTLFLKDEHKLAVNPTTII